MRRPGDPGNEAEPIGSEADRRVLVSVCDVAHEAIVAVESGGTLAVAASGVRSGPPAGFARSALERCTSERPEVLADADLLVLVDERPGPGSAFADAVERGAAAAGRAVWGLPTAVEWAVLGHRRIAESLGPVGSVPAICTLDHRRAHAAAVLLGPDAPDGALILAWTRRGLEATTWGREDGVPVAGGRVAVTGLGELWREMAWWCGTDLPGVLDLADGATSSEALASMVVVADDGAVSDPAGPFRRWRSSRRRREVVEQLGCAPVASGAEPSERHRALAASFADLARLALVRQAERAGADLTAGSVAVVGDLPVGRYDGVPDTASAVEVRLRPACEMAEVAGGAARWAAAVGAAAPWRARRRLRTTRAGEPARVGDAPLGVPRDRGVRWALLLVLAASMLPIARSWPPRALEWAPRVVGVTALAVAAVLLPGLVRRDRRVLMAVPALVAGYLAVDAAGPVAGPATGAWLAVGGVLAAWAVWADPPDRLRATMPGLVPATILTALGPFVRAFSTAGDQWAVRSTLVVLVALGAQVGLGRRGPVRSRVVLASGAGVAAGLVGGRTAGVWIALGVVTAAWLVRDFPPWPGIGPHPAPGRRAAWPVVVPLVVAAAWTGASAGATALPVGLAGLGLVAVAVCACRPEIDQRLSPRRRGARHAALVLLGAAPAAVGWVARRARWWSPARADEGRGATQAPAADDLGADPAGPARGWAWGAWAVVAVAVVTIVQVASSWNPMAIGPWWSQDRLLSAWVQYDGHSYLTIATDGYQEPFGRYPIVAWFPGYPVLIRVVAAVFGIDPGLAGFLVTLGAGAVAARCLWGWSSTLVRGQQARRLGLLVALLSPFAAYLYGAVYADAVFLACTIGAFWLLERRHLLLAGVVAAGATATRPLGMAVVLGLLAVAFEREGVVRQDPGATGLAARFAIPTSVDRSRASARLLGPLVGMGGLAAYMLYTRIRFGSALLFLDVQADWAHGPAAGATSWLKFDSVGYLVSHPWLALGTSAANAVVVCAVLVSIPFVGRRFGWGYGLYQAALVVMVVIGSSDFVGTGRYVLGAFPAAVLAGEWLALRRRAAVAWLVTSAVLLGLVAVLYTRGFYLS